MPIRRTRDFIVAALTAVAFLAASSRAYAQGATGTIRGKVTAAAGGIPVPGAQISIGGTRIGAASGPDGSYTISGVPTGVQVVGRTYEDVSVFQVGAAIEAAGFGFGSPAWRPPLNPS